MRWPVRGGNAVVLERDPLVRDQVSRLMGVLRQLAIKKNSPIRHTSRYKAALWLNDVQSYCTIQASDGPGEELLRVARVPREPEPGAPREVRDWIRRPSEPDVVPGPTLRERGGRTSDTPADKSGLEVRRWRWGANDADRLAVAEGTQCCSCACGKPSDRHRVAACCAAASS
jgi:hypothetical protein